MTAVYTEAVGVGSGDGVASGVSCEFSIRGSCLYYTGAKIMQRPKTCVESSNASVGSTERDTSSSSLRPKSATSAATS